MTSGVVADAGVPVRPRRHRSAAPPWWLLGLALLVGAGHADLLTAAGSSAWTCGSPRWSATGACADSAAYPVVWVVTQLGGRVTILVVLAVLVGYLGWRRRTLAAAGPGAALGR